jgi:hypothetical protein
VAICIQRLHSGYRGDGPSCSSRSRWLSHLRGRRSLKKKAHRTSATAFMDPTGSFCAVSFSGSGSVMLSSGLSRNERFLKKFPRFVAAWKRYDIPLKGLI